MARTDSLKHFLTDIADSIREKTQETGTIKADEFDTYINNIETGKKVQLQTERVIPTTSPQVIEPSTGYDGFSTIYVDAVDASIDFNIQSDYIKQGISILGVEGTLLIEEPEGTLDITTNGLHNVKSYEKVNVNVGNVSGGFTINKWTNDGYAEDITINIKDTYVPEYYCYTSSSSYAGALAKRLKNLSIPYADNIRSSAFYGITTLEKVHAPNVNWLYKECFRGCTSLKDIYIPKCTALWEEGVFRGCTSLEYIDTPEVTFISRYVFYGCSNLKSINVSPNWRVIGQYTFYNCYNLELTELPETIESIPDYSFYGCKKITELTVKMPSTYSIGKYAFKGSGLTKLVFPNFTSVPSANTGFLDDTPIAKGEGYVYLPDELVELAKTSTNWKTYANQITPLSEMPE